MRSPQRQRPQVDITHVKNPLKRVIGGSLTAQLGVKFHSPNKVNGFTIPVMPKRTRLLSWGLTVESGPEERGKKRRCGESAMSFKDPEIRLLFPVPFITIQLDGSEELNQRLLKEIGKRSARSPE